MLENFNYYVIFCLGIKVSHLVENNVYAWVFRAFQSPLSWHYFYSNKDFNTLILSHSILISPACSL